MQQEGQFIIVSKSGNGRVLDVSQDVSNFGCVILYQYNGGSNQKFGLKRIPGTNPPKYIIQCRNSSKVLTVEHNSEDNGKNLIEQAYQKLDSQVFKINTISGNEVVIETFCGKVLDVSGGSSSNRTPIIQWQYHGGVNQIWILRPV